MRMVKVFTLWIIAWAAAYAETPVLQTAKERIALLPLTQKGLTAEEAAVFTSRLAEALCEKFDVIPQEEMMNLLREAQFPNIETCTYSYCLADAGKVLGVPKVMHASLTRRGKLYELRLRLVSSENAKFVYDRRTDYSGEFDGLLTDVLPREATAAGDYALESSAEWYIVTAAIVVTVGAIYSIYRAFNKSTASEGNGESPPPVTQ